MNQAQNTPQNNSNQDFNFDNEWHPSGEITGGPDRAAVNQGNESTRHLNVDLSLASAVDSSFPQGLSSNYNLSSENILPSFQGNFTQMIGQESPNQTQSRAKSRRHSPVEYNPPVLNKRRSPQSTASSSHNSENQAIGDRLYSADDYNESSTPSTLPTDITEESYAGVDERALKKLQKERKSGQSQVRFAYDAIILKMTKIIEKMVFSKEEVEKKFDQKAQETFNMFLNPVIAKYETELPETLKKSKDHCDKIHKEYKKEKENVARLKLSECKKNKEIKKLEKEEKEQIEFTRRSFGPESQIRNDQLLKDDQTEVFSLLKSEQTWFINNQAEFLEVIQDIFKHYNITTHGDFEKLKKDHVVKKSFKKMRETRKNEKETVVLTIILAMALKFVPLDKGYLTYADRNHGTTSFLYFLLTSDCEQENLLRLREFKIRKHISEQIEPTFTELCEQSKTLFRANEKKQTEEEQKKLFSMLNKVLLSIYQTRDL